MLEPIWFCGGILPTALVDILETTANEDNGDDDETGEEDDNYVFRGGRYNCFDVLCCME